MWFWWENLTLWDFIHNMICEYSSLYMIVHIFSYTGDLQLCTFISFMINQVEWHMAVKSSHINEEKAALWIRSEPSMAVELRCEFRKFLSTPDIREQSTIYRASTSLHIWRDERWLDALNMQRLVVQVYRTVTLLGFLIFWLLLHGFHNMPRLWIQWEPSR